jgi:hypothetical protein
MVEGKPPDLGVVLKRGTLATSDENAGSLQVESINPGHDPQRRGRRRSPGSSCGR